MSEPYSEGRDTAEIQRVAKEILRSRPCEPRKVPTHFNGKPVVELNSDERKEFILSMQAPSTQATLRRDRSEDAAYIEAKKNTPISASAQVRHEDGSINYGERKTSIDEVLLIEDTRRKPKNSIAQGTEGSVSKEKRDKGIWAFAYSKPYNPSDAELKRLKKIDSIQDAEVANAAANAPQKKRPWWKFWQKKEFDSDKWDLHDPATWNGNDSN